MSKPVEIKKNRKTWIIRQWPPGTVHQNDFKLRTHTNTPCVFTTIFNNFLLHVFDFSAHLCTYEFHMVFYQCISIIICDFWLWDLVYRYNLFGKINMLLKFILRALWTNWRLLHHTVIWWECERFVSSTRSRRTHSILVSRESIFRQKASFAARWKWRLERQILAGCSWIHWCCWMQSRRSQIWGNFVHFNFTRLKEEFIDLSFSQIAVHNTLTHNSLTKQITFMPFYVLMNKAPFTIQVQDDKRPGDPWLTVEPEDCAPLWPKSDNKTLHVRVKDDETISRPFKFNDVQCSLLKMKNRVREHSKQLNFKFWTSLLNSSMAVWMSTCKWQRAVSISHSAHTIRAMLQHWSSIIPIVWWNSGKKEMSTNAY